MICKILISSILLLSGIKNPLYDPPKGGSAEDWTYTSLTWIRSRTGYKDNGQDKSHAVLLSAGARDSILVEAIVNVDSVIGTGWKIAGVTLYQDINNYWHLALVEAPGISGVRFFEMKRMKRGIWGNDTGLVGRGRKAYVNIWHNKQGYRLKLEKRGLRITGKIWNHRGKLVYQASVDEEKDSEGEIFPGLDNGGFYTDFSCFRYCLQKLNAHENIHNSERGFFRLTKDDGIYWLVDPIGLKTLFIGCEQVKYHNIWCQALGYAPYHRNVERMFDSESIWARDVADKMLSWGFNTVGSSNRYEKITNQGLAYTALLLLGHGFSEVAWIVPKTFWTGFPDVFDPKFNLYCRMIAERKCRLWRSDYNLLGYYIDNELEWFGKDGRPWSLFTSTMKLGPRSYAKQTAIELLRKRHGRIEEFNSVWDTDIKSWKALAETSLVLVPNNFSAFDEAEAYVSLCAEEYFRITTAAIRQADPNHMILGARFAWLAPKAAWEAAGKYCDIVSFNCYPMVDMLSGEIPGLKDTIEHRHRICGKPLIVSEWSFPALDAGLPSTHGAGMRVDDQAQRAYCAARLQEELFSLPFVVGTSWFMWADEPALGVTDSFPENSNYGLVDVGHRPYPHVTSALDGVNKEAAGIHRVSRRPWRSGILRAALFRQHGATNGGERPAVRMRQGRLEVDNGEVRLVLTPGKSTGLDSILWRGIPMGRYHPLVFQRRGGDGWLAPDKVTGFTIEDYPGNGRALVITAEYASRDTAWAAFSTKFRVIVPPFGSWFLAEMLEISSLDPRPWLLEGYYHYIPSRIMDGPKDDRPDTPMVPNYWLRRGGWFDEKVGLYFGALALEDAGWVFHPYIDSLGGQHPDIFKAVKRKMDRGEVYKAKDEKMVIYMGRDDRTDHPWTTAAFQAWDWLKTMEDGEKP